MRSAAEEKGVQMKRRIVEEMEGKEVPSRELKDESTEGIKEIQLRND